MHSVSYKIYYEDTDAGGVVYHANFLKFCERGRTEYLQALGFDNHAIREKDGVIFVVRHLEADYVAPGRLEDRITVKTTLFALKNTSFVMHQSVFRHNKDQDEDLLFDMRITLVTVDDEFKRPVRIPEDIRSTFEKELKNNG